MRRREFIGLGRRRGGLPPSLPLLGGALRVLLRPLAARAQQPKPVIGYLGVTSRGKDTRTLASFHQGLKELGFAEGQNVAIDYRWAEGRNDALPALAADLVRQQVTVIVRAGQHACRARGKRRVANRSDCLHHRGRPGRRRSCRRPCETRRQCHGVSILVNLLSSKRLELMHTLLPNARAVAVLMNPKSANAWPDLKETEAAARTLGLELKSFNASTEQEIGTAFAGMAKERAGAVFVFADGFFRNQSGQLVALAARHAIPASYPWPEFAEHGGLIGYGANRRMPGGRAGFMWAGS